MTVDSWQEKAAAKRSQCDAAIPAEWRIQPAQLDNPDTSVLDVPRACGILTDREAHITEDFDATALLEKLAGGAFTSLEVTTAFCKRAAIAQQLTSCLTETFFDAALERAIYLDDHLQRTGKPIGPLHGLPVSIKESFSVSGISSTLGFVSFLDRPPASTNSALVDILLNAGAVLYVKTNIPQTMMTPDSHNNVFGRTLNPHKLSLTAGGSSGGEGALLAMRGSVLGIGTDIAGSIRIPALCCGVVGFKPTACRVPYGGQTSAGRPGLTGILPVAGPLCRSVRDAELLLRVVCDSNAADLDDGVLGVSWRGSERKDDVLVVGVMPEDPLFPLHPPMQRALEAAIEKLAAAGHTIVNLAGDFPSLSEAKDVSLGYFNMDPDRTSFRHIRASGEPFIPSLRFTYDISDDRPEPTLRQLYDLNVARAALAAQMRRVFVERKLDVLVGVGYQSTAVPHDTYGAPLYTVINNLLNYPACVIPFGKANQAADAKFVRDVQYVPEYKPEDIEGAPCHIQITGRPMADEKLAQDARVVEEVLRE
ncbi:amidase signature domain-containing protein [Aspergillus carlsbadensis]|nr:amidase signature domain-containing protein [Aspergillus carlsbadensis]